ncbi:MAG: RAD55 family ATPase [Thermoplasmata archaeon]|nr:RAD55 family ATPase [Thermoplasmata archaeon]
MTTSDEPLLGIPDIDAGLAPYLPPGCLIVVVGTPGSGSHLLAKQFAMSGIGSTPVLYYTTSERTVDAQEAFRSFHWDAEPIKFGNLSDDFYRRVLEPQLEVARVRERGLRLEDLRNARRPEVPLAPYSLVGRFLNDLGGLDSPFRLVLDSLDFLLELLEVSEVVNLVRQIRSRTQLLGGKAMVTVQLASLDNRSSAMLEDVADLGITLRSEPDGTSFDHTLEVRKIRNHPEHTQIRKLVINETGFHVAP